MVSFAYLTAMTIGQQYSLCNYSNCWLTMIMISLREGNGYTTTRKDKWDISKTTPFSTATLPSMDSIQIIVIYWLLNH